MTAQCICGSTDIEHAHANKWQCDGCGRFHDAQAMDRLAMRADQ